MLIFTVNYDWRDIFRRDFQEFKDKVRRDHLGDESDQWFVLSYAHDSYDARQENFTTQHLKSHFSWLKPALDLRAVFSVWRVLRKKKLRPDVWLTYNLGFLPALWLARYFCGGKIVMVLTNQPRFYSLTRRLGLLKYLYSAVLERLFKNFPDYYFTINETMKRYLLDLGVPSEKITIFLTDTIRRDRANISRSQTGSIRQKLNLKPGVKMLLSVARLEAEKNFPRLLELFATLNKDHVLVILGQGSLLASLQQQAQELGISGRVFFEGWVDRHNIWNYYRDADLFVLISSAEALGIVFWEAMYMGIPILGSTVPGIIETVGARSERGLVWSEDDGVEGFQHKISFALGASSQRQQMLDRARAFVEQKMDRAVNLHDILV